MMMLFQCNRRALVLLSILVAGCGGPSAGPVEAVVPVSGKIEFDGKPIEGAEVLFIPTGKNIKSHTGSGVTDAEGQFEMFNYQRKNGLPEGDYIVTVSLKLGPDGTKPERTDRPVQHAAAEQIPIQWSNPSKAGRHNRVTVPADGKIDFDFKIPKVMSDEPPGAVKAAIAR